MPTFSGGGGTASAGRAPFTITETDGTSKGLVVNTQGGFGVNAIEVDAPHTTFTVDGDGVATFSSDDRMDLTVQGTSGTQGRLFVLATNADPELDVVANGTGKAAVFVQDATNDALELHSDTGLLIKAAGATKVQITNGAMNFTDFTSDPAGQIGVSAFALWLDPTPGATLLRIVARDSGGTLRRATIALA